jgi:hypothetical protein
MVCQPRRDTEGIKRKEVKNRHRKRNRKLARRKRGKIMAGRDKESRQQTEIGNDESKEGISGGNNEIQNRRAAGKTKRKVDK